MSFTIGIALQIGQPPAVVVQPVVSAQPFIEAEVISKSVQNISSVRRSGGSSLNFPNMPQQQSYTYNLQGEKRMDSMASGIHLDLFA